jgi:hypothetical protein
MYYEVVTQCTQSLKNAQLWLDKAEEFAKTKKFDVGVLLKGRLAPDQKDFIFQIQSACDYVKGAVAWLADQSLPKHPDTEQSVGELRERIQKTIAFAESVKREAYSNAANAKVSFSWMPGKVMGGYDYLLQMVIPNVYFHLTTAYSVLRHNGVDVGKMDFLQPLNFFDKPS